MYACIPEYLYRCTSSVRRSQASPPRWRFVCTQLIDFGFSLFTSTNALNHPDDLGFSEQKARSMQNAKGGEGGESFPPFSQPNQPPRDSPFLIQATVTPEGVEHAQQREEGTSVSSTKNPFPPRSPTNQPSAAAMALEGRTPAVKWERQGGEEAPPHTPNSCLGERSVTDMEVSPLQPGGEKRNEEIPFIPDTYFLSCMTRNNWKGPSALLSKRIVGTPGLHPPEVLKHTSYTPATDMWGLGLLINALLTGSLMPELANNGNLLFDEMHDSFPLQSLFHRLFYLLLAYALPPSEIPEEVEVLFYAFDRSKRGMVFYDDFVSTLRSLDLSIRDPEALEIFTSMYTSTRTVYSSTGCCLHQAVHALEFTPFLAGVMDKQLLLHANSLRRLFCRLDPSRKGTVAVGQVISLLGSEGRLRDELRHYLAEMGIQATSAFSFEELAIALEKDKAPEV
ncbi:hypothetical protein NCLIV_013080 [Neospora caninum Liverpool]|uniref:EF-hand domain-containing protein n=1 Tax=Neospora caninum (strain Liverpool) TaxID=572307 RepID=F0VD00_NEOCL|nr:hypothetical protein NCLIV_013080 [Neospora caninum Liverpool]CBZ51515.1 hypothetical protein NCLIV_013080 [Neospora caninum Liverpool]|eukprot:XP_003881548.1 hypothetical protein NCLIV_013080 [Neospora caninum Liverpool]